VNNLLKDLLGTYSEKGPLEIYPFRVGGQYYVLDILGMEIYKTNENIGHVLKILVANAFQDIHDDLDKDSCIRISNFLKQRNIKAQEKLNSKELLSGYKLIMTTKCNMGCKYCFAEGGNYGMNKTSMPKEVAYRSLDFLVEYSLQDVLGVDFFGGEPLIDFEFIKDVVAYAERKYPPPKKINFGIISNGTLLNEEKINYCIAKNIGIGVSVDGTKEKHDSLRPFLSGTPTYDLIIKNIRQGLLKDVWRFSCSCTISHLNNDIFEIAKAIKEIGFKRLILQIENTTAQPYALNDDDIDFLCDGFSKMAADFLKNGEHEFLFRIDMIDNYFKNLRERSRTRFRCYTGRTLFAVTPYGEFYPCPTLSNKKEFLLGDVFNGIVNHDLLRKFNNNYVDNKKICSSCWARYFCGGGCTAEGYSINNDISIPNVKICKLYKKVAMLTLCMYVLCNGKLPDSEKIKEI